MVSKRNSLKILALIVVSWLAPLPISAAPVINEVQSTNTSLADPFGQLIDWVEIYNPTDAPIDLSGYHLSDSTSNRTKFTFPAGTTLAAGQFLIVWCGQASEFATPGPYPAGQLRATNFAISAGGEPIVLTAPGGGAVIDEYPALPIGTAGTPALGRSLGRGTGPNFSVLYFYNTPTRGSANTTAGAEAVPLDPPAISLSGGIYTNEQTVTLSTAVSGGVIRYSLDGSEPTESSPAYSGPLALGTGGNNATGYSWIPTNPGGDAYFPFYDNWRAPQGSVARIHVLRARVFKSGGAASRTVTKSYVIDPAGTNRHAFPVVSIASDPANLFSDRTGIYVHGTNTYSTDWPNTPGAVPTGMWANYFQTGSTWERASHLEFFERDGTRLLEGTIGLRINGNTTRGRPRKALRIYNRNPAGSTTWTNTALFPDRETPSWNTFLLRTGGNDWNQSLFRDALVSAIAAPTGLDRQAARPVVLFLNGEYWGLHNLRERIDEHWIFHRYGLREDQFTMLEVTSGGPNFLNPTSDFSWPIYDSGAPALLDDYKDILVRAGNNEFAGAGGYAALDARIDAENFIDYSALTIWSGNTDWPGNNVLLWRSVTNLAGQPRLDGRWRYVIKDNDFALGLNLPYVPGHDTNVTAMAQHNTLAYATVETETTWANNEIGTRLLRKALDNAEFRNRFINRFADLLNTTLSAAATTAELDRHIAAYQPGLAEHSARWPTPLSWTNEVERIRGYVQARPAAVRGHIAGKFGLAGTAQVTLGLANTNQGVLAVNTIRVESATPGIGTNVSNWTGTYFRGVPVTLQAEAKPGYRFSGWSRSVATPEEVHAEDAASNYSSWNEGSNLGSGFGPWWFWTDAPNSGQAGHFLQSSRGGWGLYANSGYTSYAGRPLADPLVPGKTLLVRIKHGNVSSPGSVGVELRNNIWETIIKFERRSDSGVYWINNQPTTVGITTAYLDLEITPISESGFIAKITPLGGGSSSYSGIFDGAGTPDASDFLFYNFTAGSGGESDFFVTSLKVITPGSVDGSSNASYSTNPVLSENLGGDAIYQASFVVEPATTLSIVPPAVGAAGTQLGAVQVRAINSIGDPDGNYQGLVTLTVTGPNGFSQVLQGHAVNGVAEFASLTLPTPGSYQFNAVSGALTAAPTASLSANDAAVFLPANSAVWHVGGHWDTGTVPNGTRAAVTIPANPSVDRNVTNNAPTTVASINFHQGDTAFRNRINGTAGQALTFRSDSGTSSITVTGTGIGHANIEVAGGVVLSNDLVLDVQNIAAGNAEYGALRLQGNWTGSGQIIKRGPGLAGITGAGKTFSGQVFVEEGALTFSEPAISGNQITNYTVLPGGQLRLSSAGSPRNYLFKGPLHLAGSGRSGVPENENQGILGALRLETGSTGTVAVLTNRVELTANADIHVPATNNLTLQGVLAGSATLSKSGGGTLQLDPGTGGFAGNIQVARGILNLGGVQLANLVSMNLTNETTLAGSGAISGGLTLQAGAILESTLGTSPGLAPLAVGGLVVQGPAILNLKFAGTPVAGKYPVLSSASGVTGLENFTIMGVPPHLSSSRLVQDGGTVSVLLAETAFQSWLVENGLPADGTGAGAWLEDPDEDGFTNLQEYFHGFSPLAASVQGNPIVPEAPLPGGSSFSLLYRKNKAATDVAGIVKWSSDLASVNWDSAGVEDVLVQDHGSYEIRRATAPIQPGESKKFMRLEISGP
jgi:hypothetical protein